MNEILEEIERLIQRLDAIEDATAWYACQEIADELRKVADLIAERWLEVGYHA